MVLNLNVLFLSTGITFNFENHDHIHDSAEVQEKQQNLWDWFYTVKPLFHRWYSTQIHP